MTTRQTYQRRRYLVDRPLQMPLVWLSLGSLVTFGAVLLTCVFLGLWITLHFFEMEHDPVVLALFKGLSWMVVLEVAVLAPFVIWLSIRSTHRVAGPLVRIRAGLARMINGDYDVHLSLRKSDALQELAEDVNRLAETLRARAR